MDIENSPLIAQRVIQLRTIVVALIMGVVSFAAIAVYMVNAELIQPIGTKIITYVAAGLLLVMIMTQIVLNMMMEKSARQRLNPESIKPWLDLYQSRTIIGCALLEGPAFLALCGYMLEREPLGLIVAGVAVLVMIVTMFPTESRIRDFVERHREMAIQAR
jgi:hypothetical protein